MLFQRCISVFIVTFALIAQSSNVHAEAFPEGVFTRPLTIQDHWNEVNEPLLINESYLRNFQTLPMEGSLESNAIPWSEIYWPSYRGGINNRWNSRYPRGFGYISPTSAQAHSMSQNQLAALSPSEKYDLFVGDYSYPTVQAVWKSNSRYAPTWTGICDGWTTAAILYPEPHPVTVVSAEGIQIPFGASDVKALLSYYYAGVATSKVYFLGTRCNSRWSGSSECSDVNAGAFHIVLANQIGLLKKAFIADHSRLSEVWNNPIYQFESKIISRSRPRIGNAPGTVERVLVRSTVRFTNELRSPSWDAVGDTPGFRWFDSYYTYWLELNESGEIIGGSWYNWDRPDFLWTRDIESFSTYYSRLTELLH